MIVAGCVRDPDVPGMVTVVGPVVAELLAVSVKVLVPVVLVGLNDAVTPRGKPVSAKVTLPVKPPVGFTVIVLGTLPPCATLKALGATDNVKPVAVVFATSENSTGVIPAVDAVIATVPGSFGVV